MSITALEDVLSSSKSSLTQEGGAPEMSSFAGGGRDNTTSYPGGGQR